MAGALGGYVGSPVTVYDVQSVASSSYSYSHISSDSASFIDSNVLI